MEGGRIKKATSFPLNVQLKGSDGSALTRISPWIEAGCDLILGLGFNDGQLAEIGDRQRQDTAPGCNLCRRQIFQVAGPADRYIRERCESSEKALLLCEI